MPWLAGELDWRLRWDFSMTFWVPLFPVADYDQLSADRNVISRLFTRNSFMP